jgi:hypothetical protein
MRVIRSWKKFICSMSRAPCDVRYLKQSAFKLSDRIKASAPAVASFVLVPSSTKTMPKKPTGLILLMKS